MRQDCVSKGLHGVVWIGFVNFLAFALIASWIGGDAMSGQVRDGHYYVNYKSHLTEVSPAVFSYSQIHAGSQLLTFPLMMLATISLHRRKTPQELLEEQRRQRKTFFGS